MECASLHHATLQFFRSQALMWNVTDAMVSVSMNAKLYGFNGFNTSSFSCWRQYQCNRSDAVKLTLVFIIAMFSLDLLLKQKMRKDCVLSDSSCICPDFFFHFSLLWRACVGVIWCCWLLWTCQLNVLNFLFFF